MDNRNIRIVADRIILPIGAKKNFARIRKTLKEKFKAKSYWRNFLLFYLPLFDDFVRAYFIDGKMFIIEPDGFTFMDGLCIHTNIENELVFRKIAEEILVPVAGETIEDNAKFHPIL